MRRIMRSRRGEVGQLTNSTGPGFRVPGVVFVTEIAISNYLKLVVWIAISKFKFSLQPNYSQWGVN